MEVERDAGPCPRCGGPRLWDLNSNAVYHVENISTECPASDDGPVEHNSISCPECCSSDVFCVDDRVKHAHSCNACGHSMTWAAVKR